jgi:hypothetical protein
MEFWEVVIFTAWDEPRGAVYFTKEEEAKAFYKDFNDKYWWHVSESESKKDAYARILKHELDKYNIDNIENANIIF